jgi:ABC-type amino acid transport system permease subunit
MYLYQIIALSVIIIIIIIIINNVLTQLSNVKLQSW